MSKNQFTGTATQPKRNRNATANFVNLIMTNTVCVPPLDRFLQLMSYLSLGERDFVNSPVNEPVLLNFRFVLGFT